MDLSNFLKVSRGADARGLQMAYLEIKISKVLLKKKVIKK